MSAVNPTVNLIDRQFPQITCWYQKMIDEGQQPTLMLWTSYGAGANPSDASQHTRHRQLGVFGRDYDHDRDFKRWSFMRDNAEAIGLFLYEQGSTCDIDGKPIRARELEGQFTMGAFGNPTARPE